MTRRVVLVAVVQAIALTWLAAVLPTWQDEEFTLATTAHGVAYAIDRALTYELQAPLYFALLAALRSVNASVPFAREFSVLLQVVTTFACAAIARRIWPGRDPWIFCALVASSPFSVYAAVEIRTYALALLEIALLVAFFFEGFFFGSDLRARIAFIACAILGLYTQYFIGFEFVALFVALAVAGRPISLRVYAVCCAIVFAAFVPLGVYVRGQAGNTLSVESVVHRGFGGMLLHPVNLILTRDYTNAGARWETVFWTVLRLAVIVCVVAGRPRFDLKQIALVAIFVVVDLIYVVVSDVLKFNLEYPRHYVALLLPEAILVYVVVSSLAGKFAVRCALATAIVFAISNAVALEQTYASGAKLGDARRVGEYLTQQARPGDAIAVYPGDAVAPVARYYEGTLTIFGFPIPQNPKVYQVDAALVRSSAAATAAFDRLPRTGRLWFVMAVVCRSNIHGCDTTQTVMARRYTILRRVAFFDATLFELEPKRP